MLRVGIVSALLLAGAPPAAAADPILMFLLSMAREMAFSAIKRAARNSAQGPAPVVRNTYPGTVVEPGELRRLIDDSFTYLSDAQREEVFDALHRALLEPKNAALRGPMIEYFAHRALAVRAAQIRLAQLSYREMQMLADEFRAELIAIPSAERDKLRDVLNQRLLPVPSDLNQLLLAVLEAPR